MNDKILSFLPKVYFPGKIFLGEQSLDFLKTISGKKLVITSRYFKDSNEDFFSRLFTDSQDYFFQDREPRKEDFENLKKYCLDNGFEAFISIGGGSVVDLSKLVKKDLKTSLTAVPTTMGSGAEVSMHALLIDGGEKKIFSSSDLLPDAIILNSAFLESLPEEQIIFQAIDAFSHGMESLVSRISNPFSDALALSSAEIIYGCFNDFLQKGNRQKILSKLQIAGILAGLAQSSSGTGLCHALAHYFGVKYNIGHAKAIAIFLPDVLSLNMRHTDKYKKLDATKNLPSDAFLPKLKKLFSELDFKTPKIPDSENLNEAVSKIKKDICTLTNPYSPTVDEIIQIIKNHQ